MFKSTKLATLACLGLLSVASGSIGPSIARRRRLAHNGPGRTMSCTNEQADALIRRQLARISLATARRRLANLPCSVCKIAPCPNPRLCSTKEGRKAALARQQARTVSSQVSLRERMAQVIKAQAQHSGSDNATSGSHADTIDREQKESAKTQWWLKHCPCPSNRDSTLNFKYVKTPMGDICFINKRTGNPELKDGTRHRQFVRKNKKWYDFKTKKWLQWWDQAYWYPLPKTNYAAKFGVKTFGGHECFIYNTNPILRDTKRDLQFHVNRKEKKWYDHNNAVWLPWWHEVNRYRKSNGDKNEYVMAPVADYENWAECFIKNGSPVPMDQRLVFNKTKNDWILKNQGVARPPSIPKIAYIRQLENAGINMNFLHEESWKTQALSADEAAKWDWKGKNGRAIIYIRTDYGGNYFFLNDKLRYSRDPGELRWEYEKEPNKWAPLVKSTKWYDNWKPETVTYPNGSTRTYLTSMCTDPSRKIPSTETNGKIKCWLAKWEHEGTESRLAVHWQNPKLLFDIAGKAWLPKAINQDLLTNLQPVTC